MEKNNDDVTLSPKQRALLASIRKEQHERTDTEISRGHSTPTSEQVSRTQSGVEGTNRETREDSRGTGTRAQGSTSIERTVYGHDTRSGSFEPTNVNPSESNDRAGEETREPLLTDNYVPSNEEIITPLQGRDSEREKELNRQRQERHRERQKQAQKDGVTVTHPVTQDKGPLFNLKKFVTPSAEKVTLKKEEVKLITKTEVDELVTNLAYIYRNGSGLLDDILEIVVMGHEEVEIWQLDDDEAETLARMHLEKGRVDKQAAASARKLLSIYDKLFFIMLLGPRAAKTVSHVKEAGGFSFK